MERLHAERCDGVLDAHEPLGGSLEVWGRFVRSPFTQAFQASEALDHHY